MRRWLCFSASVLFMVLSACISNPEGPYSEPGELVEAPAVSAEHDSSYTRTEAIILNGKKVGYTLLFLDVPPYAEEPQYIQAGTRFIKDLDFENLGFISPYGKTYRFEGNGKKARFLYQHNLEKNLAHFFGKPFGTVELQGL